MHAVASETSVELCVSAAAAEVARRWTANLAALSVTQPDVFALLGEMPAALEWVFGRDGSLTALMPDGSWWGGCSVPTRAAGKLLKSLEASTLVSAYLSPNHAGLLNAARLRMGAEPALVAIIPDVETAKVILATGDFATEIAAHRLWFAIGDNWPDNLHRLLISRPGLSPPGRFIRTSLTELTADEPMISAAQSVFERIATARHLELEQLQSRPRRPRKHPRRLLIIRPSRFRLWNDASLELDRAADQFEGELGGEVVRFDSDDPASTSLLSLARAAANCDAVLAANLYRNNVPGLVSAETPWFTWVTRGPVPAFEAAVAGDRVSPADESVAALAQNAGWPAAWVVSTATIAVEATTPPERTRRLAIIADLAPVVIPPAIEDLSSHRLLWEHLEAQVQADPFTVGDDPQTYLMNCVRGIGIDADELDVHAFVDGLIVPVWQRAVAALLIAAKVPVDLYGSGWLDEPTLKMHAAGPVLSRGEFEDACRRAAALLQLWPGQDQHPISRVGKPVVRPCDSWPKLLTAVKASLKDDNGDSAAAHLRPTIALAELMR